MPYFFVNPYVPSGNPPTASAGGLPTIESYIQDNNIGAVVVHRGDAGAPVITLPCPTNWSAVTDPADGVYAAINCTALQYLFYPPYIAVTLFKLSGNVTAEAILAYAPNQLSTLPGFQAQAGGAQATKIAGDYSACGLWGAWASPDGWPWAAAQLTAVVPSPDGYGLYLLQLTGYCHNDGAEELAQAVQTVLQQLAIGVPPAQPVFIPTNWGGAWRAGPTTLPATLTLSTSDPVSGTLVVQGLASATWTQLQRISNAARVVSAQVTSGNANSNQWNLSIGPDLITAYDRGGSGDTLVLTPAAPPATNLPTIDTYLQQHNITSTPVRPGDAGAPVIYLPRPSPSWVDATADNMRLWGDQQTPPDTAYAAASNSDFGIDAAPPYIYAFLFKLTGDVDPAGVLANAGNDMRNLPGYAEQSSSTEPFGGYPAKRLGGVVNWPGKLGGPYYCGEYTVLITAAGLDAAYVFVVAFGCPCFQPHVTALTAALAAINGQTTIALPPPPPPAPATLRGIVGR